MSASPTLLGLPQEVRDMILRHVVKHGKVLVPIARDRAHATRDTSQPCSHRACPDKNACRHHKTVRETSRLPELEDLVEPRVLWVNKEIRHQARNILFRENTFVIKIAKPSDRVYRFDLTACLVDLKLAPRLKIAMHSILLSEMVDFLSSHSGIRSLEFVIDVFASTPRGSYRGLRLILPQLRRLRAIKISHNISLSVLHLGSPASPTDRYGQKIWPIEDGRSGDWYIEKTEKLLAELEAIRRDMLA
ncbi:hypothetical protein E2P81_ATG12163 [Venturia nashicola]|nr:hypothetical protein E2P81_ATG12163 [Venturia nashicola]